MMTVPLVDLKAQHTEIADEVVEGLDRLMASAAFVLGEEVKEFERAYAQFVGARHCMGVASGTDAIELGLRALDIGPGDEVILPANTFIATALAVARAGATPVLVDCEPVGHLIDPEQVAWKLSPRTAAVIAVHLYGQVAPMRALCEVLEGTEVCLLEDAAQAHGARQNGASAGTLGIAAATSFYPAKNLGAYGDAGAITTMDDAIARRLSALRNYGSYVKYQHAEMGFNSRLDSMQAIILSAKLRRLAVWNRARREAARRYNQLLAELDRISLPQTLPGNEHVFHLYVVRVQDRDTVFERLNAAGIRAGIHYPVPIHLQASFRSLGHRPGDFPATEVAADEVLSLPLFPGITARQQERVGDALRSAIS